MAINTLSLYQFNNKNFQESNQMEDSWIFSGCQEFMDHYN